MKIKAKTKVLIIYKYFAKSNKNYKYSFLKTAFLDEDHENLRRDLKVKKRLGEDGYKKYKELIHKIYESKNLNSKVNINFYIGYNF